MRSIAAKDTNTSGSLFQGLYKATKADSDAYFQHISRYIHLNALDTGEDFRSYDFSIYKYYSGDAKAD